MAWLIYSLIREALPVMLFKMTFSPTLCFISLYSTHHPSEHISGHPRKRLWWPGITDIFTTTGLPSCLGVLDHSKKEISVPWLTMSFQANTIALSWHSSWSVNTHKKSDFPQDNPSGPRWLGHRRLQTTAPDVLRSHPSTLTYTSWGWQ